MGEKYALQKKSNTSLDNPNSQDVMVNDVIETMTMTDDKKQTQWSQYTKQLMEDLLSLFNQYPDLMSSNLD